MQIFPVIFPGSTLQNAPEHADSLIHNLETALADAALGLDMFNHSNSAPARARLASLPFEYAHRVPFIHAHTVLYAFDSIAKSIGALAKLPGAPAGMAAAGERFAQELPGVKGVRDSAHHTEDRAQGKARSVKIQTKERTSGIVTYAAGAFAISNLIGNELHYTTADGDLGIVEISAGSVAKAQNIVQAVIRSFSWEGRPRTSPTLTSPWGP